MRIDRNGDGVLSRIEVIRACRSDPSICELLGLPRVIRQEDGTRDAFEQVFQQLDADDSKSIDLGEMLAFFTAHAQRKAHAHATLAIAAHTKATATADSTPTAHTVAT